MCDSSHSHVTLGLDHLRLTALSFYGLTLQQSMLQSMFFY
jgi:hypothetical protein